MSVCGNFDKCSKFRFFSYDKARSQVFAETFGTYNLMGFCTLAPGEPVSNFTDQYTDGRRGCNPRQGPEKSLVGVGIELKSLQFEDCHHSHQATGHSKFC